jgi:hypothetical protein
VKTSGMRFRVGAWTVFLNQHWRLIGLRTHLPRLDLNQPHILLWNALLLGCEISWWRPR